MFWILVVMLATIFIRYICLVHFHYLIVSGHLHSRYDCSHLFLLVGEYDASPLINNYACMWYVFFTSRTQASPISKSGQVEPVSVEIVLAHFHPFTLQSRYDSSHSAEFKPELNLVHDQALPGPGPSGDGHAWTSGYIVGQLNPAREWQVRRNDFPLPLWHIGGP